MIISIFEKKKSFLEKHLHIISFDIPFPANYGGVIDVFYKIKYLSNSGIKIHLHCFEYGNRKQASELKKICYKVYYYPRKTNFFQQFSTIPYIVKSRRSKTLIQNLLKDNYPILFEGLHTTITALQPKFKNRKKIYRESNIEHHYYQHLYKAEKNIFKKLYFLLESKKLKQYQKNINVFDAVLAVSPNDTAYLKNIFPKKEIVFLSSFHQNNKVNIQSKTNKYALYVGNLSVAENIKAVNFLIDTVFSKINYPLIIAGLNPSDSLKKKINKYTHIKLKENLSSLEMNRLYQEAHIHLLITFQATGLKLKLLNALYQCGFCIYNKEMAQNTGLEDLCKIANSPEEIIKQILLLQEENISETSLLKRDKLLQEKYGNSNNTEQLINLIW